VPETWTHSPADRSPTFMVPTARAMASRRVSTPSWPLVSAVLLTVMVTSGLASAPGRLSARNTAVATTATTKVANANGFMASPPSDGASLASWQDVPDGSIHDVPILFAAVRIGKGRS
jgi:hypothetical protein